MTHSAAVIDSSDGLADRLPQERPLVGPVGLLAKTATLPRPAGVAAHNLVTLAAHSLREIFCRRTPERAPEPSLITDAPSSVRAYVEAVSQTGVMMPVYLYHGAQICEVIRPGDTVVDLGCGPGRLLAWVAARNPETQFIGVDLSAPMLEAARAHAREQGLTNVEFVCGDMTDLSRFADRSVDAVTSSLAFHHLPDEGALNTALAEVRRILKPEGGLYIADLAHLRSDEMIQFLAYEHTDHQPALFTLDYLHSLLAAFPLSTWAQATAAHLSGIARLRATWPMRYAVALKSAPRRRLPQSLRQEIDAKARALGPRQRKDYSMLAKFFRLGGLPRAA